MRREKRGLTIIAGIITLITGIVIAGLSLRIFLGAVGAVEPITALASIGLVYVMQFVLFALALCFGSAFFAVGIRQIILGLRSSYDYSTRNKEVITYMIFDWVIAIGALAVMLFFFEEGVIIVCSCLIVTSVLAFICSLVSYLLFARGVNNGTIDISPIPSIKKIKNKQNVQNDTLIQGKIEKNQENNEILTKNEKSIEEKVVLQEEKSYNLDNLKIDL